MTTESIFIAIGGVICAILGGIAAKFGENFVDDLKKRRKDRATVRFADIDDIRKWKWSGEKFLEKLIELDIETMESDSNGCPIDDDHEGTPPQWAPVFMSNPNTWALLVTGKREIIGYWHFVALNDSDFQLAKEGKMNDSSITSTSIVPIDVDGIFIPGVYNLYFVYIGTKNSFMGYPKWRLALFNDFQEKLSTLADQGIFFREICANAVTAKSEVLCTAKGLEKGVQHSSGRGWIYSAKFMPWPSSMGHRIFGGLRERYEAAAEAHALKHQGT